jgi:hypothetical protein
MVETRFTDPVELSRSTRLVGRACWVDPASLHLPQALVENAM